MGRRQTSSKGKPMKAKPLPFRRAGICAALFFSLLATSAAAYSTAPPGGAGTVASPYTIATLQELAWVMDNPSSWSSNFLLTADINASDTTTWTGATNGWQGIGRGLAPFTGVFDGANHTVSGVYISAPGESIGFFINMDGIVKNLKLTGINVTGGDTTGGLVASLGGTVTGCTVSGYVNGAIDTGGIAGNMAEGATISSSSSAANVTGTDEVGGLVGWGCEIIDSFATGVVTGDNTVGGLVGINDCAKGITRSYATGNVSGTGIVGGLEGLGNGPVVKSFATGNVTASGAKAGGLVGENFTAIADAYANGTVTASDSAGGIAGANEWTITRVYSSSTNVSSTTNAGGLVGTGTGTVVNSYWDKVSSGLSITTGGGTGVLTAQMRTQSTYAGWDFTSTWTINETVSTPTFRWRSSGGNGGSDETPVDPVIAPGFNLGCFMETLRGADAR